MPPERNVPFRTHWRRPRHPDRMAQFDGQGEDALPTRPLPEAAADPAAPVDPPASADLPTEPFAPHVPVADLATAPVTPAGPPPAEPGSRPRRPVWPWVLLAVLLVAALVAVIVGMNLDTGDRPLSPASPSASP